MEEKELLLTIAQTALGIAGFSGVMSAFMKRPGDLSLFADHDDAHCSEPLIIDKPNEIGTGARRSRQSGDDP